MFRLGVHGLSAPEAGLVRAILSLLGGGNADWKWVFADSGPCDAMVADAKGSGIALAQTLRGAQAVLLLGDASSAPGEDLLARPLRPDQLESWLVRIPNRLESAPAAQPSLADVAGVALYKLRRWPPAELIRSQPMRLRMATQLSRRPLSIQQLAQASSSSAGECERFIKLLQGFRLIDAQPGLPAIVTQRLDTQVMPSQAAEKWSLVRSIRRRLGLAS